MIKPAIDVCRERLALALLELRRVPDPRMPNKDHRLTKAEIALIVDWSELP